MIALLALISVVATHGTFARTYAATPQRAVTNMFQYPGMGRVVVTRTNVVGQYATVMTRGGVMEGSAVTAPFLIEHFSFGWQPVDLLNYSCVLGWRGVSRRELLRLMQGMPLPEKVHRKCVGVTNDAGPAAQVEALRKMMRGPLVPYVVISGNFAMGGWYGAGGGETLFERFGGQWRQISEGGGAMGVEDVRRYGVPQSAWCAFGIYNAKCASK